MLKVPIMFSECNLSCFSQTNTKITRKSPTSKSSFLTSSRKKRLYFYSFSFSSNIKSPNTFWSINLMSRNRSQVQSKIIYINRNLSKTLSQVRMKEHFSILTNLTNFLNFLYNRDFIINHMNRDTNRSLCNSILKKLCIYDSIFIHWKISHFKSFIFQKSKRIQNTFMFNLSSNKMIFLWSSIKSSQTFNSQVITLCSSRGKNDLFWISLDQLTDILSCLLNSLLGFPSKHMRSRVRIPEFLNHKR
jgi:hypothetical protein